MPLLASLGGNLFERRPRSLDHRLDEARVIEEHAQLVDLRARVGPTSAWAASNVLAVLPAAGVGAERAGDKGQRPADAVGRHLPQRIGQQRMPIAIAPIHRQRRPVRGQLALDRRNRAPVLLVDRAAAAEMVIVLGHFEQPLAGHVPAAEDVFQKRHHVVGAVGPAERDDEQCVVRKHARRQGSAFRFNFCTLNPVPCLSPVTPTGSNRVQQYSTFCDSDKSLAPAYALSPDLQAIVDAWPTLPDATRAAITAIVASVTASRAAR